MTRSSATAVRYWATSPGAGVQSAAFRVPLTAPRAMRSEQPGPVIPAETDAALRQAMRLERVPEAWAPALRFIMARDSSGKVDARAIRFNPLLYPTAATAAAWGRRHRWY